MKKLFAALLVICIIVSCSACGLNIEGACAKADKMLVEFSKIGKAGCTYEGQYTKIEGVYCYYVKATVPTDVVSIPSVTKPAVMSSIGYNVKKEVYPELKNLFDKFDVEVAIAIYDHTGTLYNYIIFDELESVD